MLSEKKRKVIVMVYLKIDIKTNYPEKDKRFSGTVKNAHLKTTFCGSPV